VWTKDGNAPGPAAGNPGEDKTWEEAPRERHGQLAERAGIHQRPQGLGCWTSPTYAHADETSNAWYVDFETVTVDCSGKTMSLPVWAVCSSEVLIPSFVRPLAGSGSLR
jgi:hypothetical protein